MDVSRRQVTALLGAGICTELILETRGSLGPSDGDPDESSVERSPNGSSTRERPDEESAREDHYGRSLVEGPLETFGDPYLTDETEWSHTGEATLEHVTGDAYRGDRSLKVDNAGGRVEWTPPAPVDLSGVHFSLAAKLPEGTDPVGRLRIRLDDENGNVITYTNTHAHTAPIDGEWMRLDFGLPGNDVGDVDLTGVRRLQIYTYDGPPEGPGTIYFDDVRTVERPDKAYIVLEMDNPENDDEDWFFDVYNRYGFPFTAGVDAVAAEQAENVTIDRLLAAEQNGHEITSKPNVVIEEATGEQTIELVDLTKRQQRAAIRRNKRLLEDAGFRRGTHTIVYTSNSYNSDTLDVVGDYHSLGRTGGYGAYAPKFTAPFALPGNVTEPPDDRTKRRVDRIVEETLVYHVYWHNRNVSPEDLDEFLSYIEQYVREDRLEVITYSDLAELRGLRV